MSSSAYLNSEILSELSAKTFQSAIPFPWANPPCFIRSERFLELAASLPAHSSFRPFFGKKRKHGQASHDRYVLDYEDGIELAPAWQAFITELKSTEYRSFVARLLDVPEVSFRFHWHFTPSGAQVSPHCDATHKLGSHIFYFNTEDDWNWNWGGQTVLLDDHGQFTADSSPSFEDFPTEYVASIKENHSLIFGRRGNSWHGVRKIECPEGYYRKVFIVVFYGEKPTYVRKSKNILRRMKRIFADSSKAQKVKTARY